MRPNQLIAMESSSDVFQKKLGDNIEYVLGDKTRMGATRQQG